MAGGKRRHARNHTAGGPCVGAGAGRRRRRPVPELPSFVSPASVAAAFSSPSSSSGRGRGRSGRRGGAPPSAGDGHGDGSSHAVPFSYPVLRPCTAAAASEGAAEVLEVTIDTTPWADPAASVPVYSYGPDVVGELAMGFHGEEDADEEAGEAVGLHVGLGFRDVGNKEVDFGVEELQEASFVTPKQSKSKRNAGFLSIGGVRIYTEDISSPESEGMDGSDEDSESDYEMRGGNDDGDSDEDVSDDDDDDDDDDDGDSDDESSGSGSEEDLSIGGSSSVDDEVVADYMEGIGGSEELLSNKWVSGMKLADSDDDQMDTDEDEDGFMKKGKGKEKLEGYALMTASEMYGMKRPNSAERRKGKGTGGMVCGRDLASMRVMGLEDMMMVRDVRMANWSRKGPKAGSSLSQLSRSWPKEGRKSKKYHSVPGEKKKHRKELIAKKRRQRMLSRGVDLDQINNKLRKMVVDQVDILCFHPMHSRDCSQVQRVASIYHLKSGCQGSGNKRFVTVSLTGQSSLPSADGQARLDKLLGTEPEDFAVNWDNSKGPARGKCPQTRAKFSRNQDPNGKKSSKKQVSFSERPVSFVSSGTMAESVTETIAVGSTGGDASSEKVMEGNSKLGNFEMHTKGFGSKMMAKMGFIEGTGLGKDGQGMVLPIQAIHRPKSLGLGVEFDSEAEAIKARSEQPRPESSKRRSGPRRNAQRPEMNGVGSFERHTKGFGSKMMARMGFVPGSGLGKDGQGIMTPLTAVRRPKARGLGATTY